MRRVVTTGLSVKVHLEVEETNAPFIAEIDTSRKVEIDITPGTVLYATPLNLRVYASSEPQPVASVVGAELD